MTDEHWKLVARDAFLQGNDDVAIQVIRDAVGLKLDSNSLHLLLRCIEVYHDRLVDVKAIEELDLDEDIAMVVALGHRIKRLIDEPVSPSS